jgi:hypothetical protein
VARALSALSALSPWVPLFSIIEYE